MHLRLAVASLALCLVPSLARADGFDSAVGGLWITSGFWSQHDHGGRGKPAGGWNESNTGIGAEYAFDEDWRLSAGVYENSVFETSRYAQLVWSPPMTTWRHGAATLQLGAAAGVVDGYPGMRDGGFFPTLLPVASLEWHRVGLNLTYIPSIGGNVAGAFALQLKFRLV